MMSKMSALPEHKNKNYLLISLETIRILFGIVQKHFNFLEFKANKEQQRTDN